MAENRDHRNEERSNRQAFAPGGCCSANSSDNSGQSCGPPTQQEALDAIAQQEQERRHRRSRPGRSDMRGGAMSTDFGQHKR